MTIPNQTNRRTAEQGDPVILETDRLILRPLTWADRPALCAILQDAQTMTYYNGAFDDVRVDQWLQKQLDRYKTFGIGLWAVIRKSDARLIGQCGLTWQPWKDRDVLEIGYLFNRHFWHQGYAREAAAACRDYAFDVLQAAEVCSIIRDTNLPSQNIARAIGMEPADQWVKRYRGADMPHIRFVISRT